ncbi:kinase [Lithospermum erythrorhizon]|uniref:protein-ribulosamine 3-kinase n=1 Tax=Lithospermum erythrorhizon TaxID=34254 RepID=A0AAV3RJY4_LITER
MSFVILPGYVLNFNVAAVSDDPVREWILTEGNATQITRISPVGGGCINLATRYDTDAGSFTLKTNRSTGGSFIIMEFIEYGASRGNQSVLGMKLAEITRQVNTWTPDWIEFYAEHRLGYQLKLAREQFGDSTIYERGQRLVKNIKPIFEGAVIEPCLLHGDLWNGHNEAEFGMSCSAGFGESSYKAYFEVMPKQPGFEKRRDLYMLYHYLNHYNLFGSGDRSSAMSIIDDYLRMLKV